MELTRLSQLIQEAVAFAGVSLYHFEWHHGRRGGLLRVFIDTPEGVTVANCETVSRELGVLLDAEDIIPFRYTLEVSSPGMDRRLITPAHFQRVTGKDIRVKIRATEDRPGKVWVGRLLSSDDAGFTLQVGTEDPQVVCYDQIVEARLVVQF